MTKTDHELHERDAHRDIGQELLESVQQMKAGQSGRVWIVDAPDIARIRMKVGLTQTSFAQLLGVSPRTLQDWEQGRRTPSGSAQTLLKIADRHPDVLRELAA